MFGSRKSKGPPGSPTDAEGKAVGEGSAQGGPASPSGGGATMPPLATPEVPSPSAAAAPISEEAQRRAAIAMRQSMAFAQIVSVLMRSSHYKHYTLADLEWFVFPPLLTGQFSIVEASAQPDGPKLPVAVALWASVSPDVDRRLSENLTAPVRLRPDEWQSGDILWLVDAVGDARIVPQFLKRLGDTVFKGRQIKMRTMGEGGKPVIAALTEAGT
jgi:hemolysin-activating ACP:hemolysin acyltransferase